MPVFENFPYTNFHDLNLDYILKETAEVKKLAENIEGTIDQTVNDYLENSTAVQDAVDELAANGIPHRHAVTNFYIYVAGASGNDDNDGLTSGTAVKTLERAFEILNDKTAVANIYVNEAGIYDIPYATIGACEIHLTARSRGIEFRWKANPTAKPNTFYNCYLHLQGYSDMSTVFYIERSDSDLTYLECGKLFAQYITFESLGSNFAIVGAAGTLASCVFKTKLVIRQGCFNLNGCVFENVNNNPGTASLTIGYSSIVSISSSTEFNDIDAANTPYLIDSDRAVIFFTAGPTVNNLVGNPLYVHAIRSIISGGLAPVRAWLYNVGSVEQTLVLGRWYQTASTKAGYSTLPIVTDAAPGTTRYPIDVNAKKLVIKMKLLDSNSAVSCTSEEIIDLESFDFSALTEYHPAPFIVNSAVTNNVPTLFYIWLNLYTNREIRYLHNYSIPITTGAQSQDNYTVRVDISELY